MQIDIPFQVEYQTANTVPIGEIISSLRALERILEESGNSLELFQPDISIQNVQVSIQSITHQSPLRELLIVSVFVAFQSSLVEEVPSILEKISGQPIPDNYDTILTLLALVIIFYGAEYIKEIAVKSSANSAVKNQLDSLITELARETGYTYESIKEKLDKKYLKKNIIKRLANSTVQFFRPSKSQSNAPITVGSRKIARETIADVPAEYIYEEEKAAQKSSEHFNVELELHAQDKDRESTGWAAIPNGLSSRRLKMKLVDGVSPDDLWGRDKIRGDIVLISKRSGFDFIPSEIHLTRVKD